MEGTRGMDFLSEVEMERELKLEEWRALVLVLVRWLSPMAFALRSEGAGVLRTPLVLERARRRTLPARVKEGIVVVGGCL